MKKFMRLSKNEKYEIIQLVEKSDQGVNATLKELGVHKSTFYQWYNAYLEQGYDGLNTKPCKRQQYWNQIPDEEKQKVVELALEYPERSPREIACLFTDTYHRFVSESSVYRLLKSKGLITTPAFMLMQASDRFKDQTVRVNEMWQTDFTYFKIPGWGWYYLSTILDDYSRFIVHWQLCPSMKVKDVQDTINRAMLKSNLKPEQKPKLLSDNGSCYIAKDFKEYLQSHDIKHVRGRANHPQTQGKIERYHRSMKNVVKLDVYYSPMELEHALGEFVNYYNYHRYHESLNNVTPADKYYGKAERTLERRRKIKLQTLRQRKIIYFKTNNLNVIGNQKDQRVTN